jgi:hypothetical protein
LRNRGAGYQNQQPDSNKLCRVEASCSRQQTDHDQAKAKVVRFSQSVKARKRVGKAQQSDRAGQKEKGSGRNQDNSKNVEYEPHERGRTSERRSGRVLALRLERRRLAEGASLWRVRYFIEGLGNKSPAPDAHAAFGFFIRPSILQVA